jgi:hypothetical protein
LPDVLKRARRYLQTFGRRHVEGYLCWSGVPTGKDEVEIRSCIFPPDFEPSESSFGRLEIGIQRAFGMGNIVAQRGELIFAQMHSHPDEAFHSPIDDARPISHRPGFMSIVVPDFGFVRLTDLSECKVFEYQGHGRWRELPSGEVARRFVIGRGSWVKRVKKWFKK